MTSLPAKALDSDGWLDLAAAKSWGAVAVGLYLGWNLNASIVKTATELDLGLWSFWEGQSSNPNRGAPQGVEDANRACDLAFALGQPLSAPIFLPNDQVVVSWTMTLDYFDAAIETILKRDRVGGFYGQTSVWLKVKGFGYSYFCHAPDGTSPPFVGAHIVQSVAPGISIGGVSCDVDEIQAADFGGWNLHGLFEVAPTPPPPPPPPEPILRLVTPFMRGSAVLECQKLLTQCGLGYLLEPDGEDGIFGIDTEDAVRDFQASQRLKVDGIVGPLTWAALRKVASARQ
jgi:peptidoglycan hydrolase-like protein with peptidoglycan-binding domain